MKFLSSQFAYLATRREVRRNLMGLLSYVVLVLVVIVIFSILFHVIMARAEGQDHSWITGLYWTLTVMSTLGFGDITFTSDVGRLFSTFVLLSGIVLLLVMLPFVFIRFFFAPWLEDRVRMRAPTAVPADMSGHIIISHYDSVAPGLIEHLDLLGIPYYVIEPDPDAAGRLHGEGISVITGAIDSNSTYELLRAEHARLVFLNCEDTTNTNITLTIREIAPRVPIAALATSPDSVDVLELSGVDHVLPLSQQLGVQLANRVEAGVARTHVIGSFHDLLIAEFPVHDTPFAHKTLRETRLREITSVSVIGVWERGRLLPADPQLRLSEYSVPVVVGTRQQLSELDSLLVIYHIDDNPVLIIGGGKVGRAAARALRDAEVPVHMIEQKTELRQKIGDAADRLVIGDAADREVLFEAGLREAPAVLLTTHDDATNVYLAIYCRRLNPDIRLISRVTHERNVAAVVRAGADFVLSYASLGVQSALSVIQGNDLVVLGEGVDLFHIPVPSSLAGKTLAESGIGARTGLTVVAIEQEGEIITAVRPSIELIEGAELLVLGSAEQRQELAELMAD